MLLSQLLLIGLLGFFLHPFCTNSSRHQRLNASLALGSLCLAALLYAPSIELLLPSTQTPFVAVAASTLSFLLFALGHLQRHKHIDSELSNNTKATRAILLGSALAAFENTFPSVEWVLFASAAKAFCLVLVLRSRPKWPGISRIKGNYFIGLYALCTFVVTLHAHRLVADGFETVANVLLGLLLGSSLGLMVIEDLLRHRIKTALDAMPSIDQGAMRIAYRSRRILKDFQHDLRQPLSTLGILASVGRAISKDPEVGARYLHIQTAQKALKTMLEEFFEELESTVRYPFKDNIAPMRQVSLEQVLEPLVEEYRLLAHAKQLKLRYFESNQLIVTNTEALTKILRNGLDNAIKYTEQGGVLVGVRLRADTLCVQIIDTGPGVSTDPSHQMHKGWGHGSTIVQDLSEQILAKTECRNRFIFNQVRGSVFEVCLPRLSSPMAQQEHTNKEQTSELAANVLLFSQDIEEQIKPQFPEEGFDRVQYGAVDPYLCLAQSVRSAGPHPIYIAYTESNLEMELAENCLQIIKQLMSNKPCCILIHATLETPKQRIEFSEQIIRLPYKQGQADTAFKTLRELFPTRSNTESSTSPQKTAQQIKQNVAMNPIRHAV